MPFLLSLSNLNEYLTRIQTPISGYDFRLFDFWADLYATGCRPQELVQRNLWTVFDASYMALQPVKGNDVRYILKSVLSDSFWFYWNLPDQLYSPFTLRKFRYQFRQYWELGITTAGNKYIELYLFRHRYIKYLDSIGYSTAQIMTEMGITTASIVEDYVNSLIYSEFEPAAPYSPEYQALLDRATFLGYTLPSSGQQVLQNDLVVALKDAGIWALLDVFYLPATDGNHQFACLNWVDPANFEMLENGIPTFTGNSGFQGDDSSMWLNSQYSCYNDKINFSLNSASFGIYLTPTASSAGDNGATGGEVSLIRTSSGGSTSLISMYLNNGSESYNSTSNLNPIFLVADRRRSTHLEMIFNGVLVKDDPSTSAALSTNDNFILALNNGSPANYSADKIHLVYFGGSMYGLHSSFNSAVNNYLTAIGLI